jgi:hypothetical protein
MKPFGVTAIFALSCLLSPWVRAQDPKLTAEEVVSRSLASIASPQDRAAVKFYEATGTVKITATVGGISANGTALLLSEGNKLKFAIKVASNMYPSDQFVYDGKDVSVSKDNHGRRSPLGDFAWWQKALMRDGLLGGVLSTAWPLYDPKFRNAKLTYNGIKKVNGVSVHEISYNSKNIDSSTKVKMLFDVENFRHLETIYEMEMPASFGGVKSEVSNAEASYQSARYRLEEVFSDFRQLGPYTLPLHDRLSLISSNDSYGIWYLDVSYDKLNGNDLRPTAK